MMRAGETLSLGTVVATAAIPTGRPLARAAGPAAPPAAARATRIHSIGTAVPGRGFAQAELLELMKELHGGDPSTARRLEALYHRSGIRRRYSCLGDSVAGPFRFGLFPAGTASRSLPPSTGLRMAAYREVAGKLALAAAGAALRRLPGLDAGAITHVLVASCTGFTAPGLDVELAGRLELSPQIARTLVGFQGCQAGVTCLRLADSICRADPGALVLLVCVELSTLHFQSEPTEDNLVANCLFADGAAAAVLGAERLDENGADSDPERGPRLFIRRAASWIRRDTTQAMSWTVGDTGFTMQLSRLVPRLLGGEVTRFLEEALSLGAAARRDLRFWAVHPGGRAILDEIERALDLHPRLLRPSRAILDEYGNMSSPTVLFVLDRIRSEWEAEGGTERAAGIALAFGPGLTLEAVLLEARSGAAHRRGG